MERAHFENHLGLAPHSANKSISYGKGHSFTHFPAAAEEQKSSPIRSVELPPEPRVQNTSPFQTASYFYLPTITAHEASDPIILLTFD